MEWLERGGGNVKEVIDGFVFLRERERESNERRMARFGVRMEWGIEGREQDERLYKGSIEHDSFFYLSSS